MEVNEAIQSFLDVIAEAKENPDLAQQLMGHMQCTNGVLYIEGLGFSVDSLVASGWSQTVASDFAILRNEFQNLKNEILGSQGAVSSLESISRQYLENSVESLENIRDLSESITDRFNSLAPLIHSEWGAIYEREIRPLLSSIKSELSSLMIRITDSYSSWVALATEQANEEFTLREFKDTVESHLRELRLLNESFDRMFGSSDGLKTFYESVGRFVENANKPDYVGPAIDGISRVLSASIVKPKKEFKL